MKNNFSPITLGKAIRRVEAGGFILTESTHPPNLKLPLHAHEHASISLVLNGNFIEVIGSRPQACGPTSLMVKPAGELHSNQYGRDGARCLFDFIHEHFLQQVSLVRVAKSVGVHPAHLAKRFHQHYRCTVGEYIRRLRLDYAMQELAQSAKAIAEVALEVGFYDQSHFTHAFKLHTGMTPAQFRSAVQTGKSHTKKRRFSKTSSDKSAILE